MAKKKAARKAKQNSRRKRVLWTSSDLKLLRQSGGKTSLSKLARALKRSEAAVRLKASSERISLRQKG